MFVINYNLSNLVSLTYIILFNKIIKLDSTVFNVEALIEKYKCRLYIIHYGLTTMGFFFYFLILMSLY